MIRNNLTKSFSYLRIGASKRASFCAFLCLKRAPSGLNKKGSNRLKPLLVVAPQPGLEPGTHGLTVNHCIPSSKSSRTYKHRAQELRHPYVEPKFRQNYLLRVNYCYLAIELKCNNVVSYHSSPPYYN